MPGCNWIAAEAKGTKQMTSSEYTEYIDDYKQNYNKELDRQITKFGSATMEDAFVRHPVVAKATAQRLTRFKYEESPFFLNTLPREPLVGNGDARPTKAFINTMPPLRYHPRISPRPEITHEELYRQISNRHST